jgi:tyrosinase
MALRDECGYTGYQPYWNWGKWADDPLSSPLFDGSDTSLGGNGAPRDHAPVQQGPYAVVEGGHGGGCVTTGPFKE